MNNGGSPWSPVNMAAKGDRGGGAPTTLAAAILSFLYNINCHRIVRTI
jgi:hypothetical protein